MASDSGTGWVIQEIQTKLGASYKKIYEVYPLTCPNCQDRMRIFPFIENEEMIKKILVPLTI